jgi:hypothetical protein
LRQSAVNAPDQLPDDGEPSEKKMCDDQFAKLQERWPSLPPQIRNIIVAIAESV